MSPCFGNTLHFRLIWWIWASLLLIQMGPSKRDRYISWIVGIRFSTQDCEASEGVMAAPRSGRGNMGT